MTEPVIAAVPVAHLHAAILAGGSGTRFWPLSRELSPKQTLSIFGGHSLLTRAVLRIAPYAECGGIHIVTGEQLFDELRNHLSAQVDLDGCPIGYLVEPSARNTAAAIALAAAALVRTDPDALLFVLPSDQLLEEGETWHRTVLTAAALAAEGWLVTIGLTPTRPETGYGYIALGEELPAVAAGETDPAGAPASAELAPAHRVASFVEKPDRATAERYLAGGMHLWNSGMLCAKASVILAELEAAGARAATAESAVSGTIAEGVTALAALGTDAWTSDEARERYAALPSVPFDRAVLEVSDRVAVVPAELEWSDVGSLLSIERLAEPDAAGNTLVGRTATVETSDSIVYSADRLVATLGVRDLMVIDTPDATLVAAKDRAQDVRLVVDALAAMGAPEMVESRSSLRPWGTWTMLIKGDGFHIKRIEVRPGQRLSLQKHAHRSEHWIVLAGTALVERDGEHVTLTRNESVYLPIGSEHRLTNPTEEPLMLIEVAVGDYLGEDDIVRIEDDWSREKR